jgi:hypothetical protein
MTVGLELHGLWPLVPDPLDFATVALCGTAAGIEGQGGGVL